MFGAATRTMPAFVERGLLPRTIESVTFAVMLPAGVFSRPTAELASSTNPFAEPAIVTWRAVMLTDPALPGTSVPTPVLTATPVPPAPPLMMLELSSRLAPAPPVWISTALPAAAPVTTVLRVSSFPAPPAIVMTEPAALRRNASRTATPALPLTPTAGDVVALGATMSRSRTLGAEPLPVKLIVPVTTTPGAAVEPVIVTPGTVNVGASS